MLPKPNTALRGYHVLVGLALLVAPVLALHKLAGSIDARLLAGGGVAVNLLAYALYAIDKRRATSGQWRISEATLHLVELLGGWPGAFLAQRIVRHKTSKRSFLAVFWLIVVAHQFVAIDYLRDWRMVTAIRCAVDSSETGGARSR